MPGARLRCAVADSGLQHGGRPLPLDAAGRISLGSVSRRAPVGGVRVSTIRSIRSTEPGLQWLLLQQGFAGETKKLRQAVERLDFGEVRGS